MNNKTKYNKTNFKPIEDVYTYSESRILNGNKQVIRWYKNGVLTDVFGYPIQNDKLPSSGIVYNSFTIPNSSNINTRNKKKKKKRKRLSSKYSSGMSSSQLLSYNLTEYHKTTDTYNLITLQNE